MKLAQAQADVFAACRVRFVPPRGADRRPRRCALHPMTTAPPSCQCSVGEPRAVTRLPQPCAIDGCGRPISRGSARGWCNGHYKRWWRYGDPLAGKPIFSSVAARFWTKVDRAGGPDSCWLWTASRVRGYGNFSVRSHSIIKAHRFAYELTVGPIAVGLEIDHLCHNPACVNPGHLEPVTPEENRRRANPGAYLAARTHCPQGHPYDEANTYWSLHRIHRACRACQTKASRAARVH